MKQTLLNKIFISTILISFSLAGAAFAQTSNRTVKRNSPFAPNPKRKIESAALPKLPPSKVADTEKIAKVDTTENQTAAPENIVPPESAAIQTENAPAQNAQSVNNSAAEKTPAAAKRTVSANALPTEIYKVGVGDVLFVSLQNAPSRESTYFTILQDGTIDYPLAGAMVSVAGMTTGEIESLLQDKIKLYENPQVSVKVREHNSHTYTVLGMVEKAGEKALQREAVPLYVVRAESVVEPRANRAIIKRTNGQTETVDLKDSKYEDVLVFAGDIVEFGSADAVAANAAQPQFYYIGGEIISGGQKDFYKGITLTQAILASGGLKKSSVKKVVVRRKNEAGMLNPTAYDLKAIKDGKSPDPTLEAGDTIEIGN